MRKVDLVTEPGAQSAHARANSSRGAPTGSDDRVYLVHIKEAIDDIREFTRDGEAAFVSDKNTEFAVVRSLEIIGVATKRLSATRSRTRKCRSSAYEALHVGR
jgi:hypothetical protein